jgi:predicted Zn-dependent protease
VVRAMRIVGSAATGGLRLDPASPYLWSCLGACARAMATREYALSRALSLDPKRAGSWAALGRLYAETGQPLLAKRCLAIARSHDPSSAPTWEAMGTLAALSPQGRFHLFLSSTPSKNSSGNV